MTPNQLSKIATYIRNEVPYVTNQKMVAMAIYDTFIRSKDRTGRKLTNWMAKCGCGI